MTPNALVPALVIPLLLFSLYRRARRNFGRQPIQRKRMTFRIGLLGLVLVMLVAPTFHSTFLAAAAVAGLLLGAGLAWIGLRLTHFEITPDGQEFYTPNSYIGMGLMAVVVGRLVYRFVVMAPVAQSAGQPSQWGTGDPFSTLQGSPITVGILTIMIGYYLVYFIGILREGQKHGIA